MAGPYAGRDGQSILRYLEQKGLKEYRGTEGFKDVLVLTREIGEETEYVLITLWDNMEAVKRFAVQSQSAQFTTRKMTAISLHLSDCPT